jgi:hypothetical protein
VRLVIALAVTNSLGWAVILLGQGVYPLQALKPKKPLGLLGFNMACSLPIIIILCFMRKLSCCNLSNIETNVDMMLKNTSGDSKTNVDVMLKIHRAIVKRMLM